MVTAVRLALSAIAKVALPKYVVYAGGRDELVYREGNHKLTVWAEFGMTEAGGEIYLYPATTVRWGPPHDSELIPEEKRKEILHHLLEDIKKKDGCAVRIINDDAQDAQERLAAERAQAAMAVNANSGTKL